MTTTELTILGSSYRQQQLCDYNQRSLGHDSPETRQDVQISQGNQVLCVDGDVNVGGTVPHLDRCFCRFGNSCTALWCTSRHRSSICSPRCCLIHLWGAIGRCAACLHALCLDLLQIGSAALSLLSTCRYRTGSRSYHLLPIPCCSPCFPSLGSDLSLVWIF